VQLDKLELIPIVNDEYQSQALDFGINPEFLREKKLVPRCEIPSVDYLGQIIIRYIIKHLVINEFNKVIACPK